MGGTAQRLAAVVGTTALFAALLTGCSDDDGADEASSTTATTEAPTTTEEPADPAEAEREAVIDAYEAADDAALEASAPPTPNPEHPDLLATHTGPMLEQRQMVTRGLAASGWAIRLPDDTQFRTKVESVELDANDPNVAYLTVCSVDDGERFVVETGEIVAAGLGTVEFDVAMQRIDGAWKLAERRETDRWEGVAGCALDD